MFIESGECWCDITMPHCEFLKGFVISGVADMNMAERPWAVSSVDSGEEGLIGGPHSTWSSARGVHRSALHLGSQLGLVERRTRENSGVKAFVPGSRREN